MQRILGIVQERATYLWVLFLIPAASRFGHYVAPNKPVLKGHDLGIWAALALMLVAIALWIPYARNGAWPKSVVGFFVILTVTWTYQVTRIHFDDSLFNLTVVAIPVALTLISLKRTSQRDLWVSLWFLGYSLLAISIASLVFGTIGILPNGFEVSGGGGSRYPALADLGLTRWGGPFGNVNYAAPIGGLLVLIGAAGRGRLGVPLVLGGILILILSQGRAAIFATVGALVIQFLWSQLIPASRKGFVRASGVLVMFLAAVFFILLFDPTLNGRTDVWYSFAPTLDDAPLVGIGDSGVLQRVAEQVGTEGFIPHTHAHSVLLDSYIRFGAVLALLGLITFAFAIRASLRALPRVGSSPLAITTFVIIAGLAETIHTWAYWSAYLSALIWVVMITADQATIKTRSMAEDASLSWPSESR